MATLILMCGVAFSGKTTMARSIVDALGCAYVSLDDINAERGLWGGAGIPVQEWERTHQIALEKVKDFLASGRCVVLDDTNNLRWLRDRFREAASRDGHAVRLVYFDIPLHEVARRMQRSSVTRDRRLVADDVLADLVESFEVPGPDEQPIVCGVDDTAADILARLRSL